jgi:hypothetical protein
MPMTAKGKIARYQTATGAYADVMESKIKILKDYIQELFTPEKKSSDAPAPPIKKSWWPFGRGASASDRPSQ